jgi:hypothetical protein
MADGTDKGGAPVAAPAVASPGRGLGWPQAAAVAVVALAVLAAVWILAGSGGPFRISVDKGGSVVIEAKPGDDFASILSTALEKDPATVESLLNGKGFFSISDPDLVTSIEALQPGEAATAQVTLGIRKLLFNLEGPFQRPLTLVGADGRLLDALDDLDKTPGGQGTSALLAGLWQRSNDRTGVFRPRSFNADVKLLFGGPPGTTGRPAVFACPGSEFVGKDATVWTEGEEPGAVTGVVVEDVQRFDCDGDQSIEDLLGGRQARLGLDAATYRNLFGKPDPGTTLPPHVAAKFRVHPKDLTATLVLSNGG